MDKEALESIAQRPTCCKTFGESVTISRAERDALVAMAADKARLEWIAQNAWALRSIDNGQKNALVWQQPRTSTEGALVRLRAAIDAAMAKEQ